MLETIFITAALVGQFYPCQCLGAAPSAPSTVIRNSILNSGASWTDENEHEIKFSKFLNRPAIFTMMYTQCRKVCPGLTLMKLKEIQTALNNEGRQADIVIATFDPEFDTPAVLRSFKSRSHIEFENWHLVRANMKQTRQLASKLGLNGFWEMDDHIIHDFKIVYIDEQNHLERTMDRENQSVSSLIDAK